MQARRFASVARVAAWHHAGVSYHVLVGQVDRLAGYVTVPAFGPDRTLPGGGGRPDGAHPALAGLPASPDPATPRGTAECLRAVRPTLGH